MVITTILFYVVARERFGWPRGGAVPLVRPLPRRRPRASSAPPCSRSPTAAGSRSSSPPSSSPCSRPGGPAGASSASGSSEGGLPLDRFVDEPGGRTRRCARPGAARLPVLRSPGSRRPALLAALRHTDALHEQVLVISVITDEDPAGPAAPAGPRSPTWARASTRSMLRFGFMERARRARGPGRAGRHGARHRPRRRSATSLGREALRVTPRPGMARWREHLFAVLSRNATSAAELLRPPRRPDPRPRHHRRALTEAVRSVAVSAVELERHGRRGGHPAR